MSDPEGQGVHSPRLKMSLQGERSFEPGWMSSAPPPPVLPSLHPSLEALPASSFPLPCVVAASCLEERPPLPSEIRNWVTFLVLPPRQNPYLRWVEKVSN